MQSIGYGAKRLLTVIVQLNGNLMSLFNLMADLMDWQEQPQLWVCAHCGELLTLVCAAVINCNCKTLPNQDLQGVAEVWRTTLVKEL